MTSCVALVPERASAVAELPRLLIVGNFLNASVKTQTASEELAANLAAKGFGIVTTSSCMNRALRLADMLWTVWHRRHEYDVAQVAVFSGPGFLWAEAVCGLLRRIGKPYVLTLHGGNLPAFARKAGNRVPRLLQSASAVTAPSRYLQEQLKIFRSDIELLPNSIDIDHYPFRLRTTARPKLVWLRAFHKIYNPTLAVRAVEIVQRHQDVELTMVGREKDGSLAAARQLVVSKGLERKIFFNPGVARLEVPGVLAAADIFLNTSNTDNTPVSVMEAMACGLCVISTDVGGMPYLLDHGEDALLVPNDNAGAMAAAIEQVVKDPELAARLSAAGRRKVESFATESVVARWTSLFKSVAGGKRQ